ncbi:MAG: hypothetical protein KC583_12030 [Myxococcales bacterium]|nr:hypothetical protein [Myxococcales bacterium]
MKASFRSMFATLRAVVRSPKHGAAFADARGRHEAFHDHRGVASVLGVLADDGRARYDEKEALTRALIAEQQSRPGSFWASVLLVAYYPMLSRLRHRIYGHALADDDLDQLVVTSFLGVVADYPLDAGLDRTAMRLRQRTERQVFRLVCAEQDELLLLRSAPPEDLEDSEQSRWPEARPNGTPVPRNPIDTADAVSLLVEHAGDLLDGETFELVTATLICGRRITTYLDGAQPDLDPHDRRRVYQRIKRRHSRALARIRPALDHLRCPCGEADGLCQCRDPDEPEEVAER